MIESQKLIPINRDINTFDCKEAKKIEEKDE